MSRWDDEWDRPWEDRIKTVERDRKAVEDTKLAELRRAANRNLAELVANRGKLKPERDGRKSELDRATAQEIADGHAVIEFRELRKIENRYARRKTLSDEDKAHWEEVDARLDTLREQLDGYNRNELTRLVRIAHKAEKRGVLQRG